MVVAGAGDPLTSPGMDLSAKIRAPAPAASRAVRATRRAASAEAIIVPVWVVVA